MPDEWDLQHSECQNVKIIKGKSMNIKQPLLRNTYMIAACSNKKYFKPNELMLTKITASACHYKVARIKQCFFVLYRHTRD